MLSEPCSTGYGKSICYQVLPYLFDAKLGRVCAPATEQSVVLVVSPLVSLMVDQVSSLQLSGVEVGILTGNTGVDKKLLVTEKDITEGKFQFLYIHPLKLLLG